MAFAARDFFEARQQLPPDTSPPAPGTPLFEFIVQRLIDSFDLPEGPVRYFQWMNLPDEDSWIGDGIASLTRAEANTVRTEIDCGRLCCLGLVRAHSHDLADLGKNHQVLAYGYNLPAADQLVIRLYDPNHPEGETQMTIDPRPGGPLRLTYSGGEWTRGFFVSRYRRIDPTAAMSGRPVGSPLGRFVGLIGRVFGWT